MKEQPTFRTQRSRESCLSVDVSDERNRLDISRVVDGLSTVSIACTDVPPGTSRRVRLGGSGRERKQGPYQRCQQAGAANRPARTGLRRPFS
jgi:hypothetical protein